MRNTVIWTLGCLALSVGCSGSSALISTGSTGNSSAGQVTGATSSGSIASSSSGTINGATSSAAATSGGAGTSTTTSGSSGTSSSTSGSAAGGGSSGCASPTQPYSITNRPPATCPFYSLNPAALSPWPLPIDVLTAASEKAANGDQVAQNAFLGAGQITEALAEGYPVVEWATPGSDDYGRAMYYAQPTDPYFNLDPSGGSMQSCEDSHNISGPAFRAPNLAPYTSTFRTDYGGSGADSDIRLFDPVTNVIAGGYTNWNQTSSNLLDGNSSAEQSPGTKLNVGSGCGLAENIWTDQDWGTPNGWPNSQGAEGSANWAPMATVIRADELMQGLIAHTLTWTVSCDGKYTGDNGTYSAATHVFPANSDTWICDGGTEPMPPNGALLYLDYTQGQIAAMNIPGWQKTLLSVASTYGGYFGISTRQDAVPITPFEGNESGLAYQWQTGGTLSFPPDNGQKGFTISGGQPDPVFAFLAGQGIPCNQGSGSSACKYPMSAWQNVPSLTGPTCSTPCPIGQHWHMADPCVAAGLAGGGVGNPELVPTACVGALDVTLDGPGTVTSMPTGITIVGNIGRISAANGTSIILTAVPASGHQFTGWSGACTGAATCSLTLDGTVGTAVVTATFE